MHETQSVDSQTETVLVGTIASPFGIKGEVKVIAHFARMPLIVTFQSLQLVTPAGYSAPAKIVSIRHHAPAWLIQFEGVDRNQSERLHGYTLRVDKAELPALPDGEYYAFDLEGCNVVTDTGRDFGRVHTVHMNSVSHDVYETDVAMIPAVEAFVVHIDIAAKTIIVRDVPGLRADEL